MTRLYLRRTKEGASKSIAEEIQECKQRMVKEIVEEEIFLKEKEKTSAEREEMDRDEETQKQGNEER